MDPQLSLDLVGGSLCPRQHLDFVAEPLVLGHELVVDLLELLERADGVLDVFLQTLGLCLEPLHVLRLFFLSFLHSFEFLLEVVGLDLLFIGERVGLISFPPENLDFALQFLQLGHEFLELHLALLVFAVELSLKFPVPDLMLLNFLLLRLNSDLVQLLDFLNFTARSLFILRQCF